MKLTQNWNRRFPMMPFYLFVNQYELVVCTDKLRTSLVVCGAAIFLKISASTELDPGGRDSLENAVGWCGWDIEKIRIAHNP